MLSAKRNKTHLECNAQLIFRTQLLIKILKVRKTERLQWSTLRFIIGNSIAIEAAVFRAFQLEDQLHAAQVIYLPALVHATRDREFSTWL